jgi:ubiquinone/menaquinone biosynthesis C-methylase UbiE
MEYHWLYDEHYAPGVNYNDPEVAERYDETHRSIYDPLEQTCSTLDQIALAKNYTLVDLAAGTGTLAIEAAKRCKMVYAVDISPPMLCQAKRKAEKLGISNIEFIEAGFLTYEHNGDKPDVIVSLSALHHLPDFWKAVAIQRIYELLKPSGHFLLGDSAYSFPLLEYQSAYNSIMSKNKAQFSERLFEQIRMDSTTEFMTFTWILEGILDRVGFTIEKANYPTEWYVHYVCKKIANS